MNDMKLLYKFAALLGSRGGKKSAEVRFKDMTPEQKSAYMRNVRKLTKKSAKQAIKNLNADFPAGRSRYLREAGVKDETI
jgi:hypothetical protein